MLNKSILKVLLVICMFSCGFLYASHTSSWLSGPDRNWHTKLETAMEAAKKENKKIYVLSTGSDWCGWCKKLYADVFQQKEFKSFAKKNLVLVYLDSPRRKPMPQDQREYNSRIKRQLRFGGGVPSAKILDADGKVITDIGGYRKLPAYMAICRQYGTASAKRTAPERKKAPDAVDADENDGKDEKDDLLPPSSASSGNITILAWGTAPGMVENSYSFRPVRLNCGEKLYFKLSTSFPAGSKIKIRAGHLSGTSGPVSGKGETLCFLYSRRVAKCREISLYHISGDGTEKFVKTIPCDIQWER